MNLQSKAVMRQEQKLKMTPQLYQAIKLMSLPLLDLRTSIQEEIEKNPALEMIEDKTIVSIEDISKKRNEEYTLFEDTAGPGYQKSNRSGNEDSKRKFIEGTLSRPESLQDHLLWQLRLQPIPRSWAGLGEMLISNLDENGFHIESPEKIVKEGELEILDRVMKIIQTFDPIGVCTRDYREALLVQIKHHPLPPPYAYIAVDNYLDLLEKGKYKHIALKLKITEEEVLKIVDFISELEPMPGRNFATEPPTYVIPDVMIRLKDGEFVLILNDEEIPVLGINPFFTDIVGDERHKNEKDLNNFVNNSIKNAKWFIQSIKRRNETLIRVCRAIVEFQRDFFRKGPKYLVPLTLRDIAEEVGVHDSTISRISNGKYIQTEWGIFELKFFFSSSVPGSGYNRKQIAKQSVKIIIKEIIEKEGSDKHLSDKKIADILEERGIKLARRTVAKYRKELDIMSSYDR